MTPETCKHTAVCPDKCVTTTSSSYTGKCGNLHFFFSWWPLQFRVSTKTQLVSHQIKKWKSLNKNWKTLVKAPWLLRNMVPVRVDFLRRDDSPPSLTVNWNNKLIKMIFKAVKNVWSLNQYYIHYIHFLITLQCFLDGKQQVQYSKSCSRPDKEICQSHSLKTAGMNVKHNVKCCSTDLCNSDTLPGKTRDSWKLSTSLFLLFSSFRLEAFFFTLEKNNSLCSQIPVNTL